MANEIKKTNAEELSYLDIVRRQGDIKIPLIQRDYAQGRSSKKATEVREKFVKDLHKSIKEKLRLHLDFVYGASDAKRFIPLDGQQRLTTLFLIHLYLDGLRGEQDEKLNFLFTYETRDSSRLFCEKLVADRHALFSEEALGVRKNSHGKDVKPKLSAIIRDQSWWLQKWDADPTIDGMLRMLDAIDTEFFGDWQESATNLFSKDVDTIRFQFLKLENFYDPDDLFIKMNARGLPLTEFEIFKGKWMEQIEKVYPAADVKRMKTLIDVSWTDFLWPMRKKREGLKNIDPFFQNLLKLIIGNSAASLAAKGLDFDMLFEANKKSLSFSYGKYTEDYGVVFDKTMLDRIAEELNVMCGQGTIFTKFRTGGVKHEGWIDLEKEWDFFVVQDRDISKPNYNGRVYLYALSRFSQLIPDANDDEVNEWTRLVRNLVENTRFDASDDAVKAIKDIDAMLADIKKVVVGKQPLSRVNDWVAQTAFVPKEFEISQWEEEKIKAELRKNSAWNAEITEAEQHPYLRGKIGVILWCAGEIADMIPFDKSGLKCDLECFRHYKLLCMRLFDETVNSKTETIEKFLLVKAMLSKGNYMPTLSADRRNIYNDPGHRDYSWRALFKISDSTNVKALKILKQVLDDVDFDHTNIAASLKKIANNRKKSGMPLWRRLLTSRYGSKILSCSRQGFIAFVDGKIDNTLIYGSSRRSGYHAELNTLFIEYMLKKLRPDVSISVAWNMGTDADYSVTINGHTLSYWDGQWYDGTVVISTFPELVRFIKNLL